MGIHVLANGIEIIGWQTVQIVDNMSNIADAFSVSTPNIEDPGGLYLPISPFDSIEIFDDDIDDPILIGYCDSMDTRIEANSNTLTASGRSLAGDLIDCSAEIRGSALRNVDALQIAKRLAAPFGIPFSAAPGVDLGAKFDAFDLEPGETAFNAMQRAFKARSLLPATVPQTGGVELVRAKAGTATDDLIVGINCKLASGRWSVVGRYSDYRVMGQAHPVRSSAGRNPREANQSIGIATDSEVPRYRPKIIRAERRINSTEAERRARWEASYAAGKSTGINIDLTDWYQSDCSPWRSNIMVMVTVPQFNLYDYQMLVESATKSYSVNGGRSMRLKMVHPDTYTPPPANDIQRGRQQGSAWKIKKKKRGGTIISSVGRLDAGEIIKKGN